MPAIRRATHDDWPLIWPFWHAIVAAADTYTYDPATTSDEARQSWLHPEPHEAWVALLDDRVVGTYHLSPNHAGPGAHIANASYMVDAAARGRRIGRALVEHSLDRARHRGYRGVQFNAVAATNVGAIKLYDDLGFATIGRVPGGFRHPTAGFIDLLVMFHDLA